MLAHDVYQLSPQYRSALEAFPHALAVYQFVDGNIIALLVSDGMCRLTGIDRAALIRQLTDDMFARVHPDDREQLAKHGYESMTKESPYDVVYRTRLHGYDDYRLIHAVGKHQSLEGGASVAMVIYTDITDTPNHQLQVLLETESPKTRFFDEHLNAMAIVSQKDNRLLYYNKALTRLLPPQTAYDSGITFNRFFFGSNAKQIRGLFSAIDAGPRTVINPLTQSSIEISVFSVNFGQEPAYLIYFYDCPPLSKTEPDADDLRHKRTAFNTVIFSSEISGQDYRDNAYKGYRVWNLTRNICCYQAACTELFSATGKSATLEKYIESVSAFLDEADAQTFLSGLNREWLMQIFESGAYPRQFTLGINSINGTEYLLFQITMMRSPDNGDLYLKVYEQNVTEETVMDIILNRTIEQAYDYVAYSDLRANRCHIISGKTSASGKRSYCINTSEFIRSPGDIRTFSNLFPPDVHSLEDMHAFLLSVCDEQGHYTCLQELPGDVFKSVYFELISRERQSFLVRCKDITSLLRTEREHKSELERAVLEERTRAERLGLQTILSISNALDARDPITSSHSHRVAQYCTAIAKRIGWPQERVDNLYNLALVHDIGKIGVPDAVLQKKEELTEREYLQIQDHVAIGGYILKDFTAIDKVSEAALYHHERYDGTGYLRGLSGEEIPIEARIIGLADAIDAMNSTRPYRERQSEAYIRAELVREQGKQFDPALVDVLLQMIDEGLLNQD
jgi:HD-GYP domain-containing protein (c-di-GMP phosphodiesterase class II)